MSTLAVDVDAIWTANVNVRMSRGRSAAQMGHSVLAKVEHRLDDVPFA